MTKGTTKKFEITIGKVTTFIGKDEHKYLKGYKVRIIGVIRNSLKPGYDCDRDYEYVDENIILNERGPVTKWDRIEVQSWIEKEGRFSFVSSDPRATDLACFRNLRK